MLHGSALELFPFRYRDERTGKTTANGR